MLEKTAVICGASHGIGKALASALFRAQEYRYIFCVSRSGTISMELLEEESEQKTTLIAVTCDVTSSSDIQLLSQNIKQYTDKIHLLINTVGYLWDSSTMPEKNIRSVNIEQLQRSILMNTWPALGLTQGLEKLLRHKETLRMIFFSARVGSISDNGLGGWYSYRISKAALNMAMKNITIELGRRNPNLCGITYHPGTVDTQLSNPFTKRYTKNAIFTTTQAAQYCMNVISALKSEDNGGFFDWKGDSIEY